MSARRRSIAWQRRMSRKPEAIELAAFCSRLGGELEKMR